MRIRIAAAQLPVTGNIDDNVVAIGRAMDFAAAERADVLLTPEGSLSGYTPRFDEGQLEAALELVTRRAAGAGLALALGTCFTEATDGLCYNQIRFYSPDGSYLGFNSKTLRCGTMTDPPVGEVNDYHASPLRTFGLNGVKVGGLICNDLWANPACTPMPDPHLTHQLAVMGAKVVLHAVNGGRNGSTLSALHWQYHESNLLLRARADKLWIVSVDSCYPADLPCSAPSGVVTPDGEWAVRAPDRGEHCFVHTIELPGSE